MNALQRIAGGAATALAVLLLAAPASADGMRRGMKDAAPEPARRCTLSANVALTSDYVFRGISQTSEGAAVQGGFDATCGMFYAGVWASSLDWGTLENQAGAFVNAANIEMDWYGGIKFTTGKVAWDVGVIYYTYPNSAKLGVDLVGATSSRDYNYLELKVNASGEIWKGGTLGGTVYYSPDYQYETGAVWTFEGTFSQALPTMFGRITPTFSALLGYQVATDDKVLYALNVTGDDKNYTYWNAGVTFAFDKNWSLDVRYWDTNISGTVCGADRLFACDERVVGTLKFTY
jgi:uncharacterized protein (TIGR02001 family)